jgi:hypothetical protein
LIQRVSQKKEIFYEPTTSRLEGEKAIAGFLQYKSAEGLRARHGHRIRTRSKTMDRMSMVPMASLGKRFGVSVLGMESIIKLGSIIHRTDYWRRGRTWSVSDLNNGV